MKSKIDFFVFIIFIGLLSALVVYFNWPAADDAQGLSDEKKAKFDQSINYQSIVAKTVILQKLSPEMIVYGRVTTKNQTTIRVRSNLANQLIKNVLVSRGNHVKKGDTLIEIESDNIARGVEKQKINVEKIKTNIELLKIQQAQLQKKYDFQQKNFEIDEISWSRALNLHQNNAITKVDLESRQQAFLKSRSTLDDLGYQIDIGKKNIRLAEQDLMLQKLALEDIQKDLAGLKISAPFSSRILSVNVSVGDRVGSAPLLILYSLDDLELTVDVPFRLRQYFQGQALDLVKLSLNGQSIALNRVSSDLDEKTSNLYAFFEFSGQSNYVLGDLVEIKMHLPLKEGLLSIPSGLFYGGKKVYKLAQNNQLKAVECVQHGYQFKADSLKLSEANILLTCLTLKAGKKILGTPLSRVYEGMRVKVIN